jgi:LysM repeat protein
MRKDTQIGIILGVVILVVIGVFLSTRPSVKESRIPNLTLSEKGVSEVEEIDISELAKESITETTETAEDFVEERHIRREFGKRDSVEMPVTDTAVIEGKWEGAEAEIEVTEVGEIEKDITETSIPEKEIEEFSEDAIISKKKQQIPAAGVQGRIIHKVVTSDSLTKLSRKYYGDETKWKKILEANKDKIPNPDVLFAGLELLIPDITVSEKENDDSLYESLSKSEPDEVLLTTTGTHTVSPGDTLYSLARKYYGNPAMWEKIYDANEDNIIDKRLLEVGQTIIIPK